MAIKLASCRSLESARQAIAEFYVRDVADVVLEQTFYTAREWIIKLINKDGSVTTMEPRVRRNGTRAYPFTFGT